MTFQWKHKARYIVTENETLYPVYPYSSAIELCRNWRQIKQMHETVLALIDLVSSHARSCCTQVIHYFKKIRIQSTLLTVTLRTPQYCGRSLLRTESRSPAKAIGVWLELWLPLSLTLAITELRTLWWYKVSILLFWLLTKRTRC